MIPKKESYFTMLTICSTVSAALELLGLCASSVSSRRGSFERTKSQASAEPAPGPQVHVAEARPTHEAPEPAAWTSGGQSCALSWPWFDMCFFSTHGITGVLQQRKESSYLMQAHGKASCFAGLSLWGYRARPHCPWQSWPSHPFVKTAATTWQQLQAAWVCRVCPYFASLSQGARPLLGLWHPHDLCKPFEGLGCCLAARNEPCTATQDSEHR